MYVELSIEIHYLYVQLRRIKMVTIGRGPYPWLDWLNRFAIKITNYWKKDNYKFYKIFKIWVLKIVLILEKKIKWKNQKQLEIADE